MSRVVRLLTVVEVAGDAHARRVSVSTSLEAVLDDGRRVVLLDDRGWTAELRGAGSANVADIWVGTSAHDLIETSRTVVGPDEPFGGRSFDDMANDHWDDITSRLRAHGVVVDSAVLRRLPHDVVLGEALRARLRPASDEAD